MNSQDLQASTTTHVATPSLGQVAIPSVPSSVFRLAPFCLCFFSQPKVGMESLTMTDVAFQRTSDVQMQVVKQKKDIICQEEL